MLLQLSIENFRSFRDEIVFSMIGETSDTQHQNHLALDPNSGKDQRKILPISAIYGANASGKSNFIEAVRFIKKVVTEGTRATQKLNVPKFRLDPDVQESSRFELIFIAQGTRYQYGFEIASNQVLSEWLYGQPPKNKRDILFFERTVEKEGKSNLDFGPVLRGKGSNRKKFLSFVAQGTRSNQLFLTEAIDRNVEKLRPVFDWFQDSLTIIRAEEKAVGLKMGALDDSRFTEFMELFLKNSGTGIESIHVAESDVDLDQLFPSMPQELRDELSTKLDEEEIKGDSVISIQAPSGKHALLRKNRESEKLVALVLRTQHRNKAGNNISFSIDEESDGTQRLIDLIPALFLLREDAEKVIFLDELDRRLHTLLARLFLTSALDCIDSSNMNQLIFTTHDTHLLDLEILRRDEIWFIEKGEHGNSDMYSLAEFKVRPDLKIEKGYLNGRFGAIPFFGNLNDLNWHEERRV